MNIYICTHEYIYISCLCNCTLCYQVNSMYDGLLGEEEASMGGIPPGERPGSHDGLCMGNSRPAELWRLLKNNKYAILRMVLDLPIKPTIWG